MLFYEKIKDTLNREENTVETENGMKGYRTTFHPLLDLNFKLPSLRADDEGLRADVLYDVLHSTEDMKWLLKYIFFCRDPRNGLGERAFPRFALNYLASEFPEMEQLPICKYVAKYGRYDDLFALFDTPLEEQMLEFVQNQLEEDMAAVLSQDYNRMSLLAKWMPSINASSQETRNYAKRFAKYLDASYASYRKMLATLRKGLDVLECKLCKNEWSEVDYNKVPSNANLKYGAAFFRHDLERRQQFLEDVLAHKDGAVLHGAVNYPHEIVHKALSYKDWEHKYQTDASLEALWKNLKRDESLSNMIVVRDSSGSMTCPIANSGVQAIDVSTALAIYCSEQMTGEFKDKFITFSSKPRLVSLEGCNSLQDKLEVCDRENDYTNTDLQAVFELILNTAKQHSIPANEMPERILVISDMEFDGGRDYGFNCDNNVIRIMQNAFKNAGYTMPKLIFWNVNSRANAIPCQENENGVILVSGFSVNILQMVMSESLDPFEALITVLEKYDDIPLLMGNNTKYL